MLWVVVAGAASLLIALGVYLARERLGVRGVGMAALRTAAIMALVALLINATRERRVTAAPPTVLLDASLSMEAAGGQWARARDTAAALAGDRGTLLWFGDTPGAPVGTAPDAGRSLLLPALRVAAARGAPVVLVTDGELEDVGTVPRELLDGVTTVLLPRADLPDAALREASVPRSATMDDSLTVTVEIVTRGPLPDSAAALEVWEGDRVLSRTRVRLPPTPGSGRRALVVPAGRLSAGTHVLEIRLTTEGDREPGNDRRQRLVTVGARPEIVLAASPPDWESRFLARELAEVTGSRVRAFAEVAPGRWVDMLSLRPEPPARVAAAAREAALLITAGAADPAPGRARWRWPTGNAALAGDWYVATPVPASPLAGRLGGIEWDSVPPVGAVLPIAPPGDAWVALVARLARRGAERPLLIGRDTAGTRRLTTAASGLWRWALRGSAAREAYRGLLAAGVDWLLGSGRASGGALLSAADVVPRGVPLTFRWRGDTAPPAPVGVELTSADTTVRAALTFDAAGTALVRLPPGTYRWRAPTAGGASGVAVVETYSDEFVARPVTGAAGVAWAGLVRRVGVRESWWVFALALAALVLEWAWRIRRGLP